MRVSQERATALSVTSRAPQSSWCGERVTVAVSIETDQALLVAAAGKAEHEGPDCLSVVLVLGIAQSAQDDALLGGHDRDETSPLRGRSQRGAPVLGTLLRITVSVVTAIRAPDGRRTSGCDARQRRRPDLALKVQ